MTIAELKAKVNWGNGDRVERRAVVEFLEGLVEIFEEAVEDLGTAEGAIGTLQEDLGTAEGAIGTLQEDLGTAEGAISTLSGTVGGLVTTVAGKADKVLMVATNRAVVTAIDSVAGTLTVAAGTTVAGLLGAVAPSDGAVYDSGYPIVGNETGTSLNGTPETVLETGYTINLWLNDGNLNKFYTITVSA